VSVSKAQQQQEAADIEWAEAFAAHERAMPDLVPFAERLQATATAASHRAEALEYAMRAGIVELIPDPVRRHPPRELDHRASRPGPDRSWVEFDDAISALQDAEQGSSVEALAHALRNFASITKFLADAVLEMAEEEEARRSAAAGERQAEQRRAVGE
jgi:hypothetical protein